MHATAAIARWKALYAQQRAAEKELIDSIERGDEARASVLEGKANALRTEADAALKAVYMGLEVRHQETQKPSGSGNAGGDG
ncbi:MAG: hypothetical protein V4864_03845 [Pseudomonadota bacterium]